MTSKGYQMNLKGLETLAKMLAARDLPVIKVGVLSGEDSRKDGESNATIGIFHEFGTEKMPERSFLRMPINEKFAIEAKASGLLDEKSIEVELQKKSLIGFAKKLGTIAVSCVMDAFDTGGFGKWKASQMAHKKNKQTLVEEQDLRNSIRFEIAK